MEDSGREDLLKQKSAEVADAQNKASDEKVDFDSSEIGQKEKEEQFKEIEGAEERAREAERLKEKAKRDKEKADEAAAKALKKEEETPLQKKARHKKNWIILAIVFVVLAIVGALVFFKVRENYLSQEEYLKFVDEIAAKAEEIRSENKVDSYAKAKEYYQEKISGTTNKKKKFYLTIKYAEFLLNRNEGYLDIRIVLDEAKELIENDEEEQWYLQYERIVNEKFGIGNDNETEEQNEE